jgi:hypothetical protein
MIIDVMEGVLGDVANNQIRMLPDFATFVGFHITNEELDERRLARSVRAKDGNARRQRDLESYVVKLLDSLRRVLESDLAPEKRISTSNFSNRKEFHIHLEQTLFLGLDTLKEGRVREFELIIFSGFERVVRFSLGHLLDESLEIAPVASKFEAVQVKNVGDSVIQEAGIVRHDNWAPASETWIRKGEGRKYSKCRSLDC